MTIGQLKELLDEVPEDMTLDEFYDTEFMFSLDGYTFFSPCPHESGLIVLTEEDTGQESIIFAAMPHDVDDLDIEFHETCIIHPN